MNYLKIVKKRCDAHLFFCKEGKKEKPLHIDNK